MPLLRSTATLPKLTVDGVAVAVPAAVSVPTPVSGMPCGLLLAVSLKLRVAVSVPLVDGAKTTFTAQPVEGARLAPQFVDDF